MEQQRAEHHPQQTFRTPWGDVGLACYLAFGRCSDGSILWSKWHKRPERQEKVLKDQLETNIWKSVLADNIDIIQTQNTTQIVSENNIQRDFEMQLEGLANPMCAMAYCQAALWLHHSAIYHAKLRITTVWIMRSPSCFYHILYLKNCHLKLWLYICIKSSINVIPKRVWDWPTWEAHPLP